MDVGAIKNSGVVQSYYNKPLPLQRKGELHYEALERAAKEGRLQFAKNRFEVAKLAGYTNREQSNGYQWVINMVKRGCLEEIPFGRDELGNLEYQYTLTTKPYRSKRKTYKKKYSEVVHPKGNPAGIYTKNKRIEKLQELDAQGFLDKPMATKDLVAAVAPELDEPTKRNRFVLDYVKTGVISREPVPSVGKQKYKFTLLKEPEEPAVETTDVAEEPTEAVCVDEVPTDKNIIVKANGIELELKGYSIEDIANLIKALK